MIRVIVFIAVLTVSVRAIAQQGVWNITAFGARASNKKLNTQAIQKAIDKAATSSGGQVVVPAGLFITGTIFLKSGVELHLEEGAVLAGSTHPFDYPESATALVYAQGQRNISITGRGTIDGQGAAFVKQLFELVDAGKIQYPDSKTKRPPEKYRPNLIKFQECTSVVVKGIQVNNGSGWVQDYVLCDSVTIDSITVNSTTYWNNDGIDIVNSKNVSITRCTINASDDAIVLKSERVPGYCENIYVADCKLRSSANAFKLGTGSTGGFRNVIVKNLNIYDTYRSAIALEAVDGGFLENIDISGIKALNTGNALFIKLGHRNKDAAYSTVQNIRIANVYVEVPANKPDAGYQTAGPLLRYPPGMQPAPAGVVQSVSPWNFSYPDSTAIMYEHNVFPASITGLPGHPVQNVTLENIEVLYEGGADKDRAYFPLHALEQITEAPAAYPEFSMFGELPCWGLYVRHVAGLQIKNLRMRWLKPDFRAACIFDDVTGLKLDKVNIPTQLADVPALVLNKVQQHALTNMQLPVAENKAVQISPAPSLQSYVQPLAGTAPSTTSAALKHSEAGSEKNANTIPATTLPFAMTQWTPQTRLTENKCIPPYFYKDSLLSGFRGTHWLSGSCTQDYGSFTVMPVVGNLKTTVQQYAMPFSHKQEYTSPSYYKLTIPKQGLTTEITPSLRGAILQFTINKADSLYILVMPNSDQGKGFVKVDAAHGIVWGYNPAHRIYQGWGQPTGFNGWFYIKVSKVAGKAGTFNGRQISPADSLLNTKEGGAYLGFALNKGDVLQLRIGTSFSSLEGARQNLQAEIADKTFATVRTEAEQAWEKALSQITVQTDVEKDKRIFYTALYHAFQHPRLFSDVDGSYPAFGGQGGLKKMADGHYYDDFSMWDIYRAQLPLMEILQPSFINQLVRSLILKGQQGGWLPIFPCWNSYTAAMIGDHAAAFMAAAYAKGIRDYDVEAAYKLMRKNAFETAKDIKDYRNGMGRRALPSYLKYSYIPMEDSVPDAFHKKEQVSRTLEYAYDDYALSVMAGALGKTADQQLLQKRALNYQKVFDKQTGMVRGRYANGRWYAPFKPDAREPYITEGTPRQYTFYVPQDVPGLATLMGGEQALERSLDSLFIKDEYWHGNEPGHQIPFMYNYTPAPWKTQQQVRRILAEEYSDGAGGLSGNDDAGQMSAWYVFASIGFYPLNPVTGEYLLTTPLFDQVRIATASGAATEIVTHKESSDAHYISKVEWNGVPYLKNFITYPQLMQGGKLEIWLTPQPSNWGAQKTNRPTGLSK